MLSPDRDIENARKGNPGHKRHKTPSHHHVEPMERDDSAAHDGIVTLTE
jgi:hypothetical protein